MCLVPPVLQNDKRLEILSAEKCACISVIGCAALPLLWRFSCMIDLKYFIKLDYQSIGACSQLKQRSEEKTLRYDMRYIYNISLFMSTLFCFCLYVVYLLAPLFICILFALW